MGRSDKGDAGVWFERFGGLESELGECGLWVRRKMDADTIGNDVGDFAGALRASSLEEALCQGHTASGWLFWVLYTPWYNGVGVVVTFDFSALNPVFLGGPWAFLVEGIFVLYGEIYPSNFYLSDKLCCFSLDS
jgi:hypothetical protein